MKFIRKTYWYLSAYLQKHGWLLFIAVLIGVMLFAVVSRVFPMLSEVKTTRYIGRAGSITLATLPRDLQQKISDGLTALDADGQPVPALASRWVEEDDGKTYRFILSPNRKWQDGKEVVPQDVVYNFSDVQVLTTQNEVVFKLKDPFAPFPVVVSQPLFREVKKNKWWFFSDPTIVGTGTYKVTKIKKEGDKIVELELTSLEERLVYRFYPTEDLAFLAFKRGEVDALERMTSQDSLSDWKRLKITPALQEDQYIGVFFNTNNQLFDKPIRQALNYALPKVEGNERALTPIDPRSWAYNKTVKEYAQDQAKAISLLLRAVPQQRLSFELSTVPNFQHDAEQIRSLWEELGTAAVKACQTSREVSDKSSCANLQIAVQLKIVNVPDVSNFQVLLIAQQAPQDPDQYYLWHSTQQTNFTGYRNPHVDKLLEDGRKSIDQKERKSLYQAFQELLIDDSPAIFLRHTTWYTIER